jgi:hypothetical protein
MSRKKSVTTEELGRLAAEHVERMSSDEKAKLRARLNRAFGTAKFKSEVKRLIEQGRMPTLEEFLKAVTDTRDEYRPLILATRKKPN